MYDSHVDTHHLWSCGVHQLRNNTSPSIHLKTFKSKDYVLVEKKKPKTPFKSNLLIEYIFGMDPIRVAIINSLRRRIFSTSSALAIRELMSSTSRARIFMFGNNNQKCF